MLFKKSKEATLIKKGELSLYQYGKIELNQGGIV